MSSINATLDSLAQEVVTELPTVFATRYSTLCAAVLVLYDYFLTFPLELQHIWQGKINAVKVLFGLNRYSSFIFVYGEIINYFIRAETDEECRVSYYIYGISDILSVSAIFGIFTFRTYTIYGRSRTVFLLLAVPVLVSLSSGIWQTVTQTVSALPPELQIGPWTCIYNEASSESVANVVNYISSAVFDVLVVILTVCRTGRLALQSRKSNISGSLSFVLLRDGMVYYSVIFVPQFVLVALYAIVLMTGSADLSDASDALSNINSSLQFVMVNRLILNLCHSANRHEDSEFRTRTGLEPPTFATGPVLGNIGGPVRSLPDDPDDLNDGLLDDDEQMNTDNI